MHDEYLVSTFDINEFQFVIKEDLFGLGYKRLNVASLFGQQQQQNSAVINESPAANLLFPQGPGGAQKGSKKGITGQVG